LHKRAKKSSSIKLNCLKLDKIRVRIKNIGIRENNLRVAGMDSNINIKNAEFRRIKIRSCIT
jgi:hypothetical protein